MAKVQITGEKISNLGEKLSSVKSLKNEDQELLVATFALAGEAIKSREGIVTSPKGLGKGMLEGFKGSAGPQIGGGVDPLALDVGVDINVNW